MYKISVFVKLLSLFGNQRKKVVYLPCWIVRYRTDLKTSLFSTLSYGQLKQTKLTDEEVNVLATKTSQGFGEFNYNEIKKYKLENILVYIAEFQYEGKTIALQKREIV